MFEIWLSDGQNDLAYVDISKIIAKKHLQLKKYCFNSSPNKNHLGDDLFDVFFCPYPCVCLCDDDGPFLFVLVVDPCPSLYVHDDDFFFDLVVPVPCCCYSDDYEAWQFHFVLAVVFSFAQFPQND